MLLLPRAGYLRTPWKNGGGTTEQIAIAPEGATLAAFSWRVSTAIVAQGGPFSLFSGYERLLIVTEGPGLVLVRESGKQTLQPLEPFRFSGAEAISAEVTAPVRDYNVFVDTAHGAECDILRISDRVTLTATADTQLITCVQGALRCGALHLDTGDSLRSDAAMPLVLEPVQPSIAIHVRIRSVR